MFHVKHRESGILTFKQVVVKSPLSPRFHVKPSQTMRLFGEVPFAWLLYCVKI